VREVPVEEYLDFASRNKSVVVGRQVIPLEPIEVVRLEPLPEELGDVSTTVWSFPRRGSWATHRGNYRGNWAPQIPRALILKYTKPGDVVLDPMAGSGTTCIEAVLLGRNCVAVDINYGAVMLTHHRLYYLVRALGKVEAWYRVLHGDARRLDKMPNNSADLVATHPPYFGAVKYGGEEGDLSKAKSLEEYLALFRQVAGEVYRVLKPGGVLGVLVGDARIKKRYVPASHYALLTLLDVGFVLKEEVVKVQHNMKATREVWRRLKERDFLLIHHEKLYIVEKRKDVAPKYSTKQQFIELKV
jgi:ubiquinone/menaquinone biosynthesis C-methylase UbiE